MRGIEQEGVIITMASETRVDPDGVPPSIESNGLKQSLSPSSTSRSTVASSSLLITRGITNNGSTPHALSTNASTMNQTHSMSNRNRPQQQISPSQPNGAVKKVITTTTTTMSLTRNERRKNSSSSPSLSSPSPMNGDHINNQKNHHRNRSFSSRRSIDGQDDDDDQDDDSDSDDGDNSDDGLGPDGGDTDSSNNTHGSNGADLKSRSHKRCNKYGWFLEAAEAQYSEEPLNPEKVKSRELKWISMTRSDPKWNRYVSRKFKVLRARCRKGIPHSVRGRAWFFLCGGHIALKQNPDILPIIESRHLPEQTHDEIMRDLHRQYPSHEMFADPDGYGQRDLYRVLKACAIMRPEIGYCQAQAPIAAVLLMAMPAEHASWALHNMCTMYLTGYFNDGLETVQLHAEMLVSFVRRFYPTAHKMLMKYDIVPILFMTDWFMCLFARTLPWPLVLRIWDMFMCEGIIVIFKVAIVLVGSVLEGEKKSITDNYVLLTILKKPPPKYLTEKFLLPRVIRLDLTETDLRREHAIQANARAIKKIKEEKNRKSREEARSESLPRPSKREETDSRPRSSSIRSTNEGSRVANGGGGGSTNNNNNQGSHKVTDPRGRTKDGPKSLDSNGSVSKRAPNSNGRSGSITRKTRSS